MENFMFYTVILCFFKTLWDFGVFQVLYCIGTSFISSLKWLHLLSIM